MLEVPVGAQWRFAAVDRGLAVDPLRREERRLLHFLARLPRGWPPGGPHWRRSSAGAGLQSLPELDLRRAQVWVLWQRSCVLALPEDVVDSIAL